MDLADDTDVASGVIHLLNGTSNVAKKVSKEVTNLEHGKKLILILIKKLILKLIVILKFMVMLKLIVILKLIEMLVVILMLELDDLDAMLAFEKFNAILILGIDELDVILEFMEVLELAGTHRDGMHIGLVPGHGGKIHSTTMTLGG